jgi:hypothetical protein
VRNLQNVSLSVLRYTKSYKYIELADRVWWWFVGSENTSIEDIGIGESCGTTHTGDAGGYWGGYT